MPGIWELLIILAIVMLLFGASRLPQLGDALGRTIRNLRQINKDDEEVESGKSADEIGPGKSKLATALNEGQSASE